MRQSNITVGIVTYPGCMQSAVYGLNEMFTLANNIISKTNNISTLSVETYDTEKIQKPLKNKQHNNKTKLTVIIIPPCIDGKYYLKPKHALINWIRKQHTEGSIICSICAGAFILGAANLLKDRKVTTHWGLSAEFSNKFPEIPLDTNKILINDGDIITGGLMSWMDLGLELVTQFTNTNIMRELGKALVIDTGLREQRYYKSFSPKLDHGDDNILKAQHYIQKNYDKTLTITSLSKHCFLSERTYIRRFVKATGLKPTQYVQNIRIQKACELIETTHDTIDVIAFKTGYEDTGAFRKIFVKITGLTPKEFKRRFY